jgi:hypothetical protein
MMTVGGKADMPEREMTDEEILEALADEPWLLGSVTVQSTDPNPGTISIWDGAVLHYTVRLDRLSPLNTLFSPPILAHHLKINAPPSTIVWVIVKRPGDNEWKGREWHG